MVSRRQGPAFSSIPTYENFVSLVVPPETSDYDAVEQLASQCSNPFSVASLPDELRRLSGRFRQHVFFGEVTDCLDQIAETHYLKWWLDNDGRLCMGPSAPPQPDIDDRGASAITPPLSRYPERGKLIDRYCEELSRISEHCKGRHRVTEDFCRERCPSPLFTIWDAIDNAVNMTRKIRQDFFEINRPDRATASERYAFLGKLFQLETADATKKLREKYLAAIGKQGQPRGRAVKKSK